MPTIRIENPNDVAVDVRVVGKTGWLGLGGFDQKVHAGAFGSSSVDVPKGKYYIRYKHTGAPAAFQGDDFKVEEDSLITITLKMSTSGNYGTRSAGDDL